MTSRPRRAACASTYSRAAASLVEARGMAASASKCFQTDLGSNFASAGIMTSSVAFECKDHGTAAADAWRDLGGCGYATLKAPDYYERVEEMDFLHCGMRNGAPTLSQRQRKDGAPAGGEVGQPVNRARKRGACNRTGFRFPFRFARLGSSRCNTFGLAELHTGTASSRTSRSR